MSSSKKVLFAKSENFERIFLKGSHNAKTETPPVKPTFIGRLRSGSLPGWLAGPLLPSHGHQGNVNVHVAREEIHEAPVNNQIFHLRRISESSEDETNISGGMSLNVIPSKENKRDVVEVNLEDVTHKNTLINSAHADLDPSEKNLAREKSNNLNMQEPKFKRREIVGLILSALYGKLIVVMGIGFPLSEVMSPYIPAKFYDGFYLFLYFGSIIFMICNYEETLRKRVRRSMRKIHVTKRRKSILSIKQQPTKFGSFYLRIGALAFGIGSMIYSGLELAHFIEMKQNVKCQINVLMVLTPTFRVIFTFMQMYFIFLNAKPSVSKVHLVSLFGFMHMIGTNLCVWFNVLIQETIHEINHLNHNGSNNHSYTVKDHHHITKRGITSSAYCRETNIMGSIVENASPFLFPCTIEYSLICAGILYIMWKDEAEEKRDHLKTLSRAGSETLIRRNPQSYTVDCGASNKGLFLGIILLVLTIINLIIFFVFITRPEYETFAMLEINLTEFILKAISTIAVLATMYRLRNFKYSRGRDLELDNVLLVVAQTGSFIYNVFAMVEAYFTYEDNSILFLLMPIISLVQVLLQTLFILDASMKMTTTEKEAQRKPGREIITFLLVTNFALWSINVLENARASSHKTQLEFFGVWAWTIVTRFSMPLAIFYRFHSTVCLCEIWKKAYKVKSSHHHHNEFSSH